MERLNLAEETVLNANSYAPISIKEEFVEHCVARCLQKITVNLSEDGTAMPNMYEEDTFLRSRYMMAAFVRIYLGLPTEVQEEDEWLMSVPEYDKWAGSHILNQLERMKGKADLRDKVFDMLRDYRDLEKRLSTAIYSKLNAMNDPANRIFLKIQMDTSEEALANQKKELEDMMSEFQKLKEEHEQEEKG